MQISNRKKIAGLAAIIAATAFALAAPAQASKPSKPSKPSSTPGAVKMACRKAPASVDQPAAPGSVAQWGAQAPNFKASRLDCGTATLNSIVGAGPQGHVTFINFFASWCEYCIAEANDLTTFYNANHRKGLNAVGIDTADDGPPAGDPSLFYAKYHFPFLSVWDTPDPSNPIYGNSVVMSNAPQDMLWSAYATQPAVACIPTTFWLHKDGTIAVIQVGQMSPANMAQDFKWAQTSQSALEQDPNYLAFEAQNSKCTG